jgi:hypothetical protein
MTDQLKISAFVTALTASTPCVECHQWAFGNGAAEAHSAGNHGRKRHARRSIPPMKRIRLRDGCVGSALHDVICGTQV